MQKINKDNVFDCQEVGRPGVIFTISPLKVMELMNNVNELIAYVDQQRFEKLEDRPTASKKK